MSINKLSEKDEIIKSLREKQSAINKVEVIDAIELKIDAIKKGKTIEK